MRGASKTQLRFRRAGKSGNEWMGMGVGGMYCGCCGLADFARSAVLKVVLLGGVCNRQGLSYLTGMADFPRVLRRLQKVPL